MNKNDLQEAIQNVDKDIVSEVAETRTKVRKFKWPAVAIPAACFILAAAILTSTIIIPKLKGNKNTVDPGTFSDKDYFEDGVIESNKKYTDEGSGILSSIESILSGKKECSDGIYYSAASDEIGGDYYPEYSENGQITAGTLTAGEWKDLANISDWVKLINENKWYEVAAARNIYTNKIVKVTVKYQNSSCFNVAVKLMEGENVLYTGKTDVNGEAFLLYNVSTKNQNPTAVEVLGKTYNLDGKTEITIEADNAGTELKQLDLMLMIDTTGSMGDELIYLQEELKDMVQKVSAHDEALSIRVSVNFYRDEGDDYVVKYYDFRSDIDECVKQISEQSASGGGDFPEAVHTALNNAVNHQWRNDAVKLCFIVLDAPPHTESELQGVNDVLVKSLSKASQTGIRVIPVMCSGADDDTEYTLRSFAVMTGGTFIYLTDDSGIGGSHQDVTVGEDVEIETLNECMTRVVCEYCGLK